MTFKNMASLFFLTSSFAFAADGIVHMVNWFEVAAHALFGDQGEWWIPMVSSAGIVLLIVLLGQIAGLRKVQVEKLSDEDLLPPAKFGVKAFLELGWAVAGSTLENILGEKHLRRFAPVLAGTFFFIIIMNLFGVIPGFYPASATMNTTLGMALVIFVLFMWVGLRDGGIQFIKHMCGPIALLAPIIFFIEFVGMLARPVSLSLRLFGNISGDHLVFKVFSTLVNLIDMPFLPVPAALLGFGTLVASLQAFIFMTLSAVYVRMSLDTADHHDHH